MRAHGKPNSNPRYDYEKAKAIVDSNQQLRILTDVEKEQLITRILESPFLDLTDDWAFKRVLGNSLGLQKNILEDILEVKISSIEHLPNEIAVSAPDDKHARVDVCCTFADTGKQAVIEMQNHDESDFHQRMYYYGAALSVNSVKSGKDYTVLKPSYVICFANFDIPHENAVQEQCIFRYTLIERQIKETYPGEPLNLYMCELPRLRKSLDKIKNCTAAERWLYLFRNCSNFEGRPEEFNDSKYDEVFDQARTQKLTEEDLMDYLNSKISEARMLRCEEAGYIRGKREGKAEGREEGREEGRLEMTQLIRNLLAAGLDVATVAAAAGMTEEAVEALK